MKQFETLGDASEAIAEWYYGNKAAMPETVATRVKALMGSASKVELVYETAQLVYAHRDQMMSEDLALGAGLLQLAHHYGFDGLGADDIGLRMSDVLRREAGEKCPSGSWPSKATDPESKERFALPSDAEIAPQPPVSADQEPVADDA